MKRILAILIAILSLNIAQAQFHVLHMEESNMTKTEIKRYSDFYFHSSYLRMDTRTGDQVEQSVLYDRGNRTVYMIDQTSRKYFKLDEEIAENLKARIEQMKKMAEERIATLPPEQQEMARKMMDQQMGNMNAEHAIESTGEEKEINSYECSEYLMTEDGEIKRKMWVASYSDMGIGKKEVQCLEDFSSLMASFAEAMGSNLGDSNFLYQEEIQGLPVNSVDYDYGQPAGQNNVVGIKEYTPDRDFFKIPMGFTEQQLEGEGDE